MITRLILLIWILAICSFASSPWRTGEMEIRVKFNSHEELSSLKGFNFNGDIYSSFGYGNLYVIESEFNQIKNAGFEIEILEKDLLKRSSEFWKNSERRATYMSSSEIISLMDSLTIKYPQICSKTVYGESVEGRELSALKISDNVNADEPEPEIIFDGGIHGDELGGPENVARFAQFLCEEYDNNSTITDLIDSREIWLFCTVNPDGREYVSRANARGADLNRNWGYMWNGECLTSQGFSQPETRAIRNCLLENQFSIQVSNHSGIEAIYLPWCYTRSVSPEYALHEDLAKLYLSTSEYGYFEICQSNHDYATTGETVDFAYGVMGTAALTMELSSNKQPNNPTSIYNKNQDAMVEMIRSAGEGIEGFVTDVETGEPVAASLYFNDSYPTYSDPKVGDFHKYLENGSYEIHVKANGYESQTLSSITISHSNRSKSINIEMNPLNSRSVFGYKVVYLKKCNGKSFEILGMNDSKSLTLGSNGEVVVDMQYPLKDDNGNDLTIHSSGSRSYQCYVSVNIDGPWKSLGTGTGKSEYDFKNADIDSVRYVKVTGSNVSLDAIEGTKYDVTKNSIKQKIQAPNPKISLFNSYLKIEGLTGNSVIVDLYNAFGQKCLTKQFNTNKVYLDTKKLSKGVYFVRVEERYCQFIEKISITK